MRAPAWRLLSLPSVRSEDKEEEEEEQGQGDEREWCEQVVLGYECYDVSETELAF